MSGLLTRRASWRRRLRLSYRGILGFVLLATQALVSPLLSQEYHKLYAQAAVSTAKVEGASGKGLGVAIGDGTILVTCNHVVDDVQSPIVRTGKGDTLGSVIARNKKDDLAFIKIDIKLVPIKTDGSTSLLPTQSFIMAAGMRDRIMDMDMRPGTVLTHFEGSRPNYMMTSLPEFGFSGGPVLDASGRLVGLIKSFAHLGKKSGMEVIPSWKIVEFADQIPMDLVDR